MKKTIKTTIVLLISIILIFNIPLYSNAKIDEEKQPIYFEGETERTPSTLDEILKGADNFTSIGDKGNTPIDQTKLTALYKMISGVLLTIAIAVTLISSALMGINFLIQSVEEKAKIKESMVPWIIGIIISFGAYGIWEITIKVFTSL